MVNTKDCDWLASHGLELSERFAGKWIAVQGERVIGVGNTVSEADAQARRLRPEQDYILEFINSDSDLPHVD